MAITGLTGLISLITPAQAILDPVLADVALADARLVQLITTASYQIQRYLGYVYAATGDVPADVQLATSELVALWWGQDVNNVAGNVDTESLGQYSISKGNMAGSKDPRLARIMGLLWPHKQKSIPTPVFVRNTSSTRTEDRDTDYSNTEE